ncbi:MAG TPA: radical SAM protein [Euzebyales bacterium]|nr:radical SAM protein [Euzebyales bacterium]
MMRTFADIARPGRDRTGGQLPLALRTARTVATPEFAGMTFLEVETKSALNKVSGMPFAWSINPYRGCSHACTYCFARPTHRYLELSPGADFENRIVVKTNVVEVLRAELARPSWRGEKVALGTNTDPYQRCEGRYRLMPGIIGALADAGTPLSILTKGTLITRDRDLLVDAADRVDVTAAFTVGMLDDDTWRASEPGTPHPRARLDAVRTLNGAGVPTGVMLAPIMPGINDDRDQLAALVDAAAAAGATHITPIVLHLRPGVREVFWPWLEQAYPDLVGRYRGLYRTSQAPRAYRDAVQRFVEQRRARARRRHGQPDHAASARFASPPRPAAPGASGQTASAQEVSRAHAVEQLRLL